MIGVIEMYGNHNYQYKTKKNKIEIIIIILAILLFPGVLNSIRYEIESRLGIAQTFIAPIALGVYDPESSDGEYFEEVSLLDDLEYSDVIGQFAHFRTSDYQQELEFYIYGYVINSNEPLIVILNDEVIFNKKLSSYEIPKFWEKYYLDKNFVVELKPIAVGKLNKVVFVCGEISDGVNIYID